MEATVEPKPFNPKTDPHFGNIFFLEKFKGFQQYVGGIEWKSSLNRLVFLAVGSWPKNEKQTEPFDLTAALAQLGYVKASAFSDLIAIAEMMPEFNDPSEVDAFASLMIAKEAHNSATPDAPEGSSL